MAPLNVLISHALLDLTRNCECEGAEEVVLWSNLLRVVGDDGVDVRALPTLVRLSRRAVKSTVGRLVGNEWATSDGGVVQLTDAAQHTRRQWGEAIARAETNWPAAPSLRPPLEALVSQLPLEYSHYPCGYGGSDERVTGGSGIDWKPVARDSTTDTVSAVSVLALLSQALVGFAAEYESRGEQWALQFGLYFDTAFTHGPVPLADVPPALRITGNGKSSAERHGAVTVDQSRRVRLTALGRRLRDAYQPTVQAVEASLPGSAALRRELETVDLTRHDHADHPDVRYVGGRVGFAEVSARG